VALGLPLNIEDSIVCLGLCGQGRLAFWLGLGKADWLDFRASLVWVLAQ